MSIFDSVTTKTTTATTPKSSGSIFDSVVTKSAPEQSAPEAPATPVAPVTPVTPPQGLFSKITSSVGSGIKSFWDTMTKLPTDQQVQAVRDTQAEAELRSLPKADMRPGQALQAPLISTKVTAPQITEKSTNLDSQAKLLEIQGKTLDKKDPKAVNDYNTKVTQFKSDVDNYNTDLQSYNAATTAHNTAFNNNDEKIAHDIINEDPTQTGFLGMLKSAFIPTQFVNSGDSSVLNKAREQVNAQYATDHPVLATVAQGLGQALNVILIGKAGGGFNLSGGVSEAAGGLKNLYPTLTRVAGLGAESGSIFGIANAVTESLRQIGQKQFDPVELAKQTGEGIGTGIALGGAGALPTAAGRVLASGGTMGGISTLATLTQNGKITQKDWVNIFANTITAMLFEAAGGRNKSDLFNSEDMSNISREKTISIMTQNGNMTRTEAIALSDSFNKMNFIVKSGLFKESPQTIGELIKELPKVPFKYSPEVATSLYEKGGAVSEYYNSVVEKVAEGKTLKDAIVQTNKEPFINSDVHKEVATAIQSHGPILTHQALRQNLGLDSETAKTVIKKVMNSGVSQATPTKSTNVVAQAHAEALASIAQNEPTQEEKTISSIFSSSALQEATEAKEGNLIDIPKRTESQPLQTEFAPEKKKILEKMNEKHSKETSDTVEQFNLTQHIDEAVAGKEAVIIDPDRLKKIAGDVSKESAQKFSRAAEYLYDYALATNKNPNVKIVAGGPGAGKSEIATEELKQGFKGIIYDAPNASSEVVERRIQKAVDAGKKTAVYVLISDPIKSWEYALQRQIVEGREIPIEYHANQHMNVIEMAKDIAQKGHAVFVRDIRGADTIEIAKDRPWINETQHILDLLNKIQYNKEVLINDLNNVKLTEKQINNANERSRQKIEAERAGNKNRTQENKSAEKSSIEGNEESSSVHSPIENTPEEKQRLILEARSIASESLSEEDFLAILKENAQWNIDNPDGPRKTELADLEGTQVSDIPEFQKVTKAPDLTVKTLERIGDRKTVSKQFIADLAKKTDIKKVEKDIIEEVLAGYPDDTKIDVAQFAKDVRAELLPLKINTLSDGSEQYEYIVLSDAIKGNVADYSEHIYSSTIETSAGSIHFNDLMGAGTNNYFGHTRIEDMSDKPLTGIWKEDIKGGDIRRVIEVQSDLYQKGRLEEESNKLVNRLTPAEKNKYDRLEDIQQNGDTLEERDNAWEQMEKLRNEASKRSGEPNKKLAQYNDPTAHFRMVREEIRKAAQDGKTKLQFPTGETAMKIEGLGQGHTFNELPSEGGRRLTENNLKIGKEVLQGFDPWIITDVLGDGKFKAVLKGTYDAYDMGKNLNPAAQEVYDRIKETFDISGKIDISNPIYKFYQQELGKYLKNKYGAELINDDKGVSWWQIDINPDMATTPVEAFQKKNAKLSTVSFSEAKDQLDAYMKRLKIDFDVESAHTIFTGGMNKDGSPELAYAVTFDNKITLIENVRDITADHEMVHMVMNNIDDLPVFKGITKNDLLQAANNGKKVDLNDTKLVRDLSENIAEGFEKYVSDTRGVDHSKIATVLRNFYEKLKLFLTNFLKAFGVDINAINDFYRRLAFAKAVESDIAVRLDGNDLNDAIYQGSRDILNFGSSTDTQFQRAEQDPENVARSFFRENNFEKFSDTVSDAEEINASISKEDSLSKLLEQKILMMQSQDEWLQNHPAAQLRKYVAKSGEFKGVLPEVTGQKEAKKISVFGINGDVIAMDLGYKDSEGARADYENYLKLLQEQKDARKEIRNLRNEIRVIRRQKLDDVKFLKDIQIKISDTLTKKVFTFKKGYQTGMRVGAREMRKIITNQLRNSFDTRLEEVKRNNELSALRTRIIDRQKDYIKQEIKDYVKENLSVDQQGKFISMVVNASTQKDLIEAFSRIDTAVDLIERKQAIADLRKSITKALESSRIAVDYKQPIESISASLNFTNHRESTIARLEKLSELIKNKQAKGENITIPQAILDTLKILERKNVSDLSMNEISNISSKIELLTRLGATKLATIERLYEIEKTKKKDELFKETTSIEKKTLEEAPIGEKLTFRQKFVNLFRKTSNAIKKVDISITPMDVFFDMLGGANGTYDTAPTRIFKTTMDEKYGNYILGKDRITDPIFKLTEELKLDESNFDRIGVHAARMQEGGMEKLLGTGLTQKEIDDVVLTSAENKLYDAMREALDALRPQIANTMRTVYNQPLGNVKNYFSFMTDFEAMSDTEVFQRMSDSATEYSRPSKNVEKGFTVKRVGGRQKIKLNALRIFTTHIDNANYLIYMARDIKMLSEIANSPDFGEKAGDMGQRITLEWLDLMAKKGGKAGDERIPVLDALRRNIGIAYLGFKLSSAIIQPTALLDGASRIGRYAFSGMAEFVSSKKVRTFMDMNFPEIKARVGDDPAFSEMSVNPTIQKIQEASYWALKQLDEATTSGVVWGAYTQKMKELGLPIDFETVNKEALNYAQLMTRQTQASTLFKDLPMAITRGGLTGNKSFDKALLQFQTFSLNRWSNIKYNMIQTGLLKGNFGKAFQVFFYLTIAYIVEEGLRRVASTVVSDAFGTDNTANQSGYEQSVFLSALGTVPFVSQVLSVANYDSDFIPGIGTVRTMINGSKQLTTAKNMSTKEKGAVNVGAGIGGIFGIPGANQAAQILKGLIGGGTNKQKLQADAMSEAKKEWTASGQTSHDAAVITKKMSETINGKDNTKLKEDEVRKTFALFRAFGDDQKAQDLNNAKNNDAKVVLLNQYRQEMGPDAFRTWFNKGRLPVTLLSGNTSPVLISDELRAKYLKSGTTTINQASKNIDDLTSVTIQPKIQGVDIDPPTFFEKIKTAIADNVPFFESKYGDQLKNLAINNYPFTDIAKKDIQNNTELSYAPQDAQDTEAGFELPFRKIDYIPGGAALLNTLQDKNIPIPETVLRTLLMAPDKGRAQVQINVPSTGIIAHELFHAYATNEGLDIDAFNKAWDSVESDPTRAVDMHIATSGIYNTLDLDSLANERFAYLGEVRGVGGLQAIPAPLQKFYSRILKTK